MNVLYVMQICMFARPATFMKVGPITIAAKAQQSLQPTKSAVISVITSDRAESLLLAVEQAGQVKANQKQMQHVMLSMRCSGDCDL